ncbi:MAG: SMP-30/gluconolactonase/LRE family protein [Planctomycetaceae bacterium]|jgi:gluconolactonase|nr:SMP-30/gluconolactonase/LRE family protein [Planctomycetaceae bacterium]MBT4725081.1 SMP-30/gluconolactonase/LRE family protein [Planctomycetaceae bacterium]MBT4843862.1 SMP-30/gluconolactonase/LRE family protein [Planctomycetaceae bacterium]MBT5124067.1 SMP-30/gluconolactonase/LRE family protein [Planctomycetaceae bacterium]MBT5597608.1 SMP-30/gluconolactonase/LRE family protein [Planctomycetaceae bacterium]
MLYDELATPSAAQLTSVASLAFTEGPACHADGSVYYSDILNNRIMRWTPASGSVIWRQPSHRTNGQTFDPQGRLLHCEGAEFGSAEGGRRITRTNLVTGDYEVLTDNYGQQRYNSPNDICVDANGNIYFTDPCYDDRSIMEMECDAVYRIDGSGNVQRIISQPDIQRPNGIAVNQAGTALYLVDSCPVMGGNRKIWKFTLDEEGRITSQKELWDFGGGRGADGMRLSVSGNLYIAAGISTPRGLHENKDVPPGVYVLSPEGQMLARVPIGEDVITNLAFGGTNGQTIFITAGKTLYRTEVPDVGEVAYPTWAQVDAGGRP